MVVRACGTHQGAGEMSAGFEASGDLQMAGEEWYEDGDGRQGQM